MKQILIYTIAIHSLLSSCSNFDDYNTNPDNTTYVTPKMLATGALLNTFRHSGDSKAYIGNNALSKYVAYINEGAYAPQYNLIGSCSYSTYSILPNLNQMVENAKGTVEEESYRGLAYFIKAYNGYRLTMMTGDIPYLEAGKAKDNNVTPKYDTQESVFANLLNDLRDAESSFSRGSNFQGDIIYEGNSSKWQKASNAMQLKVLISLSNKITNEQKKLFADIVSKGNLLSGNEDNLKLVYTSKMGTWHPLYNQKLFVPYTSISDVIVEELKNLKDRRLFYFAEPSSAKISSGIAANDFNAFEGANPAAEFNDLNVEFQKGTYSIINRRYELEAGGDPFQFLTYAEQCFIIAEAIELGWISGDSKSYYEDGVRAALKMVAEYDIENKYNQGMIINESYISTYFDESGAYADNKEERLKQIWYQKYISKYLQDGIDAYLDFRRTRFPEFPINESTNQNIDAKDKFPVRWSYPSGELRSNYNNLQDALKRQFNLGYDGINEEMWLLKF